MLEIGKSWGVGGLQPASLSETVKSKFIKGTVSEKIRWGDVAELVECFSSVYEAMASIPRTR